MRGRHGLLASPGLWFALALTGSATLGVERWRRNTAHTVTRREQARLDQLLVCLLGRDGPTIARDPATTRQRLRALAMASPLDPAPTWLDRCVPLARDLARDGVRVEATHTPTNVAPQIAARGLDLTRALRRVGLVWQVRAGDPEVDLEALARLLAQTAAEVDLAGASPRGHETGEPCAPEVPAMPGFLRVEVPGLQPLPLGDASGFLVAAPLPTLSRVHLEGHGARVAVVANDDARAWRLRPQGLVRVLAEDGAADGLAPLRFDSFEALPAHGRMAAPPPGAPLSGVSLDAVPWGDALWVAHAIRGNAPALVRMPRSPREPPTAARLPALRAGAVLDDEVAVGTDGAAVFAARTERSPNDEAVTVSVVRARGGARAVVLPVPVEGDAWRIGGRHPGLTMCASRTTLWLIATGRQSWRIGTLGGASLHSVLNLPAERGRSDEIATARCGPEGALVYARDRPRGSPVVWCGDGGTCTTLPRWSPPEPATLPAWTLPNAQGERRPMPEWPMRFARTARGAFVAARAAGTLVAVTRADPAAPAWEPERVVYDAAARTVGATVQNIELYADASRVVLAITTADELLVAVSTDEGRSWHQP